VTGPHGHFPGHSKALCGGDRPPGVVTFPPLKKCLTSQANPQVVELLLSVWLALWLGDTALSLQLSTGSQRTSEMRPGSGHTT
jgi:hypothetical protein